MTNGNPHTGDTGRIRPPKTPPGSGLIKWIKEWIFNDPPLVVWHSNRPKRRPGDGRREVSKKPKQKTGKRPR
jgi:hypothetical protein